MNLKQLSLFIILSASISACQKPSQSLGELPHGIGIYEPADVPLIEKGKLSKEDRIHATKALFQALEDSYVLWTFKQKIAGIDPAQVANNCIAKESVITQPSYRSDFLDRLTLCVAELKDSHLNLNPVVKRSTLIGLIGELAEVDGRIYIASVRRELIDHAIQSNQKLRGLENLLVPGTEVLAIDGVPSQQAIEEIQKYVSGSTELAAKKEVFFRFFQRNFAYPKSKSLKLILSVNGKQKSLELPWYFSSATDLETDVLLGERQIPDHRASGVSASSSGFYAGDAIYSENELNQPVKFYTDEGKKEDFLTFGFLKDNPKKCYLKLSTFNLSNRKTYGDENLPLDVTMVLENLLMRCEAVDAELILDLYYNEGGDLWVASALLGALLPESVDAKILRSFKAGKNMWEVTNVYRTWAQHDSSYQPQYEALRDAYIGTAATTPWLMKSVATEIAGIFPGKIKVITSPYCISACDALVAGLKAAKRATIIGEPTNGTGAGFISVQKTSYTFIDANNLFRIAIPNQLFSVAVNDSADETMPFDESHIIENRPALPDVPYSLSLKDITNNFADLKALVSK